MFFIISFNSQKSTPYGPILEHQCNRCNNIKYWELEKRSSYVSLFFIPIIPLGIKYIYYCPICNETIELDKEHFSQYKAIALLNIDYYDNKISEDEWQKQVAIILDNLEK